MSQTKQHSKPWLKRVLIIAGIILLLAAAVIWYVFTEKFSDTATVKPDYDLQATELLRAFVQNEGDANKKYAEKIILVKGRVTAVEAADTSINIKMADTATGNYIIFAFQQQHLAEAKTIREGDIVAIKGSCSGGAYSKILESEYVTFKRSAISK